jgi:hypothetical protein
VTVAESTAKVVVVDVVEVVVVEVVVVVVGNTPPPSPIHIRVALGGVVTLPTMPLNIRPPSLTVKYCDTPGLPEHLVQEI